MENIKLTAKRQEIMNKMNFDSLFSVLRYYPNKYDILKLVPLSMKDHNSKVTIEGNIVSKIQVIAYNTPKMRTIFSVMYDNMIFKVIVFSRFSYSKILMINDRVVISGKYNAFTNEIVSSMLIKGTLNNKVKIIPHYSLIGDIKDSYYKSFVSYVYEQISSINIINDIIPEKYIKKYHLISLNEALKNIHFPSDENGLFQAKRYLKYEEFLSFCLLGALKRKMSDNESIKHPKKYNRDVLNKFSKSLPFNLTASQIEVEKDILNDLNSNRLMNRLLQGDVGSGKTIVALIALIATFTANYQGCIMAPTDILAKQHYNYFKTVVKDFNIRVGLLVSDMQTKDKNQVLNDLKNNEIDIVVGTHALIQENVVFNNLGLAIVDEQHRFGVKQRVKLKSKGKEIDTLYMSATPIPRTLASTIYMDMDVSTINTYPYKERIVETKFINENDISKIVTFLNEYLLSGQKIYVVCPCIEESTKELNNVKKIHETLSKQFLHFKVGLLHGKMKASEKQEVMNEFENTDCGILVSTTVIEVGINVLNANMMIIYNSERFGLAQIHQLRGRIARDGKKGYCYLLSASDDENVIDRLNFICSTNDGFSISEYDLKNRGAGDMLGIMQSGKSPFVIANLIDDINILKAAHEDAIEILTNSSKYEKYLNHIKKQIDFKDGYID